MAAHPEARTLTEQASVDLNDLQNRAYKRLEASDTVKAINAMGQRFEARPDVVAAEKRVHEALPESLKDTRWDPNWSKPAEQPPVIELDEQPVRDMGELDEPGTGYATSRYQVAVDKIKAAKKK